MNVADYKAAFAEPKLDEGSAKESETRAGRALTMAQEIRRFEIDLYWKRATYFWAFIAAAFAGYALTYRTAETFEPWLSVLFSSVGLVFSFAWYLVNRGSKFWQINWERHVDILEDITLGPLYKVIASSAGRNPLTAAGQFSVTNINQILSVFVTLIWLVLFIKSVGPIWFDREIDEFKFCIVVLTICAIGALWKWGKSNFGHASAKLTLRSFGVET